MQSNTFLVGPSQGKIVPIYSVSKLQLSQGLTYLFGHFGQVHISMLGLKGSDTHDLFALIDILAQVQVDTILEMRDKDKTEFWIGMFQGMDEWDLFDQVQMSLYVNGQGWLIELDGTVIFEFHSKRKIV